MVFPNVVYSIAHHLARAVFTAFFNLKVINREKLIEDGSCVYVVNHQSFLDPPLMGQLLTTEAHFLARKTLLCNWFMNFVLPRLNTIPIDQEKPDPSSILKLLRVVRGGGRVVVFPEGSRCPDGKIHDAMPGIGLIISKLGNVPIQPIRIEGAYDALPIHSKKIRFTPITMSIGDPIHFEPEEIKAKGRAAQLAIGKKIMDAIKALPTSC